MIFTLTFHRPKLVKGLVANEKAVRDGVTLQYINMALRSQIVLDSTQLSRPHQIDCLRKNRNWEAFSAAVGKRTLDRCRWSAIGPQILQLGTSQRANGSWHTSSELIAIEQQFFEQKKATCRNFWNGPSQCIKRKIQID